MREVISGLALMLGGAIYALSAYTSLPLVLAWVIFILILHLPMPLLPGVI